MQVHHQVILGCVLILSVKPMLLPGTSVQTPGSDTPLVTIDGSLHPELISDDQALHIWLITASGIADPSPEHGRRTRAIASAVGLNPTDTATLLKAVNDYGGGRRALASEASSLADPTTLDGKQQRDQISAESAQLFTTAKTQINSNLSAGGKQQFAKHLLHVKQHMRIGPGRNMGMP